MLTHRQIWDAIDALAIRHSLSTSGLAKRAGLDPTTFNKSKRISVDGKPRWPSTESVSKILEATGCSLSDFVGLVIGEGCRPNGKLDLPLIGDIDAGALVDAQSPGPRVDVVPFPDKDNHKVFALRIHDDSMLPAYRGGDIVIVAPEVEIRGGDRVVARTKNGETLASRFVRKTPEQTVLHPLGGEPIDRTLDNSEITWIARIIWASQ